MTKKSSIEYLVDEMTSQDQVSLLSGEDYWSLPAIKRLGIGKMRVSDGPNGARGGGSLIGGVTAAAFPVGIAIGASWNKALAEEIGSAIADEVKSKGAHVCLAPTVNIHRSVTNGRNFECYSEDPELTSALAVGYINGLQSKNISATIKHFVGNESEVERTTISSEIDERTLREVYLRPFEEAVKDAGTWGIMSSYNRLNGTYTAENEWLLTKVLREDWGYDGVVMSDWFGSRSTAPTINAGLDLEMPGPSRDRGEKLIKAVEAGEVSKEMIRKRALNMLRLMERVGSLDDHKEWVEKAENKKEHRSLIRRAGAEGAVLLKNEGILPLSKPKGKIAVIGPNAKTAQIMGGGSAQLNPHYCVSPWDALLERFGEEKLIYAQGCTNHRWEPVLEEGVHVDYFSNTEFSGEPVHSEDMYASVAFWVPPIAEGKVDFKAFSARIRARYSATTTGLHHFGLHNAGLAKLYVNGELVVNGWDNWQKGRTFFEEGNDEIIGEYELREGETYDILVEFRTKPTDNLDVACVRFGVSRPLDDAHIKAASEVAARAETALLFIGRSGEWDTEGSDLENITLPGRQNELVKAVLAANPYSIIILQTGGPVEMPWVEDVPAILQAWYPGQEAGNAIVDVLFGDVEPSGRLPQTFPKYLEDNPTQSQDQEVYPGDKGKVRYKEGVFIGYRHYDKHAIAPLFPFGHGLGYTNFTLKNLHAIENGNCVKVSATLTNSGKRKGSTVIQIWVSDNNAPVERPIKELKSFEKFTLEAGKSTQVSFDLPLRAFAYCDVEAQNWCVAGGEYVISAGFSASDIHEQITIDKARSVLEF